MLDINLSRQLLPLATPAFNSAQRWSQRESLLLRLQAGSLCGLGEAAPLPRFSSESLQRAHDELRALDVRLLSAVLEAPNAAQLGQALAQTLPSEWCASAWFAAHTALSDLWCQRRGLPLWYALQWPGSPQRPQHSTPALRAQTEAAPVLPTCELLDLAALPAPPLAACYKVKLSRDWQPELLRLSQWCQGCSSPPALRLDANGAIAPTQVEALLQAASALPVQFVEEPCALTALGTPRRLVVPLALDESLAQLHTEADVETTLAWIRAGAVRALVLKPMLLGPQVWRWLSVAQSAQLEIVFSHLFDGTVAGRAYQHWSHALGSRRLAMGLGAQPGLELWQVYGNALDLNRPGLGLRDVPAAADLPAGALA